MNNESLTLFKDTIQYHESRIWIKPVCDFFGISYENQTRKINSDHILANQSTKMSNSLMFGDNYQRILLTKKGFIRWIQLINPTTVAENLREKFKQYQSIVFDFLFGSMEENENMRFEYARNKKLKTLLSKIGREIQKSDQKIRAFMDGRYLQQSIAFRPVNEPISNN